MSSFGQLSTSVISSQGRLPMNEFVLNLLKSSPTIGGKSAPFHFFEQDFTYGCFEYQALYIADEFYHTRYAVRLEYGLESLSLSRKFFKKVCAHLLASFEVCIWGKKSKELNCPYEILARGGPGNVRAVEDVVGGFGDIDVIGDYIAVLHMSASYAQISFSLAYFNDSDYHLTVLLMQDDDSFSKLQSLITQYGIKECILLICEDSTAATKHKKDVKDVMDLVDKNDLEDDTFVANNPNNENEDATIEEITMKKLVTMLEEEMSVFVDTLQVKAISTEKDRHSIVAEIADIINPSGFDADTSGQAGGGDAVQAIQRLQQIDESFLGSNSALLTALVALRRQQRVEKLRHRDASSAFQIPISFSVKSENDEAHKLLLLDQAAISSLQLLPDISPFVSHSTNSSAPNVASKRGKQVSLFRLLDRTCTTMGRRLLRNWIQRPSAHLPTIQARQQSISFFMQHSRILATIRESTEHFKQFPDFEKLLQRLRPLPTLASISATGNRELRDILELYKCITRAKTVCDTLVTSSSSSSSSSSNSDAADVTSVYVQQLHHLCDKCAPMLALVEAIIDADHLQASYARSKNGDSSSSSREGEALFRSRFLRIKPDLTAELQNYHDRLEETTQSILTLVATLPAILSIEKKELHLERSDVHGIHLRVTKRLSSKVLKTLDEQKIHYRVLSQQKAGMLFLTKPLESLLLTYDHRKQVYETSQLSIVLEAMKVMRTYVSVLQAMGDNLATIDALMSLATVALAYDWVMPTFHVSSIDNSSSDNHQQQLKLQQQQQNVNMKLEGLYHPLLRDRLGASQIVTSDLLLQSPCTARNIFGPNMGGKSTFLKAVGTIAVMAQMGSAVPCRSAVLPLFDRIFLRTGAAESAALGMSSFLAEMSAMAEVLRLASSRSLVLIDEIGRGTSTADGFGLAWAILEELVIEKQATVLCATHFHELARLEQEVLHPIDRTPLFASLHVDAAINTDTREIQMMYKVLPGSSDRSYGIHCAKVAGFPEEIVENALVVEAMLDAKNSKGGEIGQKKRERTGEENSPPSKKPCI